MMSVSRGTLLPVGPICRLQESVMLVSLPLLILRGWTGPRWSLAIAEPLSLLCGFLWASSQGRAIPLALSETQRRQCAAPPVLGRARPGRTLPHCAVLSTQLLQLLIPEPVLSQPLSSEPVGGGGWTLLAQASDGWQLQLWVAVFLQPSFQGSGVAWHQCLGNK